jgi:hypothetical protein
MKSPDKVGRATSNAFIVEILPIKGTYVIHVRGGSRSASLAAPRRMMAFFLRLHFFFSLSGGGLTNVML